MDLAGEQLGLPDGGHRSLPAEAREAWLVSHLWDDDWRCVGGSADLIQVLASDPGLRVREIRIDEDATPPGFQSR
jgi:hypothetical protein